MESKGQEVALLVRKVFPGGVGVQSDDLGQASAPCDS
jgi:hypothetical protein